MKIRLLYYNEKNNPNIYSWNVLWIRWTPIVQIICWKIYLANTSVFEIPIAEICFHCYYDMQIESTALTALSVLKTALYASSGDIPKMGLPISDTIHSVLWVCLQTTTKSCHLNCLSNHCSLQHIQRGIIVWSTSSWMLTALFSNSHVWWRNGIMLHIIKA